MRTSLYGAMALSLVLVLAATACGSGRQTVPVPGEEGAVKSAAGVRAQRRAYDGAPPVIPHDNFNIECTSCHSDVGMEVPDVGYSPPMPHESTAGLSAISRCRQCHVFAVADDLFSASSFRGLRQDLRSGGRLHTKAPPTIPHKVFMRENCVACHSGPAAREEVRTSHPERERCRQCHVQVTSDTVFVSEGAQI